MFTLGDYYKNSYDSRAKALNTATTDMLQNAKDMLHGESALSYSNLENFLNSLMYPNSSESNEALRQRAANIQSILAAQYKKAYDKALQMDFSNSSNNSNEAIDNALKIIKERHGEVSHKTQIQLNTIKQRLMGIQGQLKEIDDIEKAAKEAGKTDKILTDIQKDIKALGALLNNLISMKMEGSSDSSYLKFNKDDDIYKIVGMMDDVYKSLLKQPQGFTGQEIGDVFEWFLQLASYSDEEIQQLVGAVLSNKIKDIEEAVKEKTAGQDTSGGRGVAGVDMGVTLDITGFKNITEKDITKTSKQMTIKEPNGTQLVFNYQKDMNPYTKRKGKMDVSFSFNDTVDSSGKPLQFRMSAKNWLNSGDFGETNLLYALSRSINDRDVISRYSYILSDNKQPDASREIAHSLAKLSIFLDLIMGYSQKQNYADTLVINFRSIPKIKVYSISQLLTNCENILANLPVTGYDKSTIVTDLIILRNAINREVKSGGGRSRAFQDIAMMYFNSFQVSISSAILKNYVF